MKNRQPVRRSSLPEIVLASLSCFLLANAQDTEAPGPRAASATASTQPADAEPSRSDIIVTAQKPLDELTIRALARAITPRISNSEPLARFADPVCFVVSGLSRQFATTVANRLVLVAQQANVPLAGDQCKPNVLLIFVDDGKVDLQRLTKQQPWLFRNMEPSEVQKLAAAPGPVHLWTASEMRSPEGDRLHPDSMFGNQRVVNVSTASHILLPLRRDVLFSVILIDRNAAIGRNLTQIADYSAMRTLAMIRPDGTTDGDTILTLFDRQPATPPNEMTHFDRSYLKALYAGDGNQRSMTEVRQIARQISRDIRHGDDGSNPASAAASDH